jgi:hypothetical protein
MKTSKHKNAERDGLTTAPLNNYTRDLKRESQRNKKIRFSKRNRANFSGPHIVLRI